MSEQLQLRRGTATQVAAFTGAQGECVMDTTNNRLVINDGTTAGGWPAAKLGEVITNARTTLSDVSYTVAASDRMVAYAVLTAARTVALIASASYPTGTRLVIVDETGNCSMSKTITIAAAGTDLINGLNSVVINVGCGFVGLENNGAGEWTVVDQGFATPTNVIAALPHGANMQCAMAETLVTLSASSTTASVPIPANCIVLAVGAYVVTAITGAPSYAVGVTGNPTQFGSALSISVGSSNYGLIGPTAFYSATNLIVTATSGSFSGGQVRLSICYINCNPSFA